MIRAIPPAFCLALLLFPSAAIAVENTPANAPLRHLVYSFTYGSEGNLTVHSEQGMGYPGAPNGPEIAPGSLGGAGAGSGAASAAKGGEASYGSGIEQNYSGATHDRGTITVDVLREQPDTGLIVTISEQAAETRRAEPATCVVYGTTTVICDPNKMVNSEELTLLRFLGRNFIDPNKLDTKGHWSLDQSNSATAVTADYSVAPGKNGLMSVEETRVVKNLIGQPITTDVTTAIAYDMNLQLPTTVQEYAIRREYNAGGGMKTTIQTTLTLVSDSMAKQ